jgi:hypothetical protein
MIDEKTRKTIALKRFSILAPIINKQVKNNMAYYVEVTKQPIEMPFYGPRIYSPKTIESWYCDYMREGSIDGLMPSIRGDKGNFRKLTPELKQKITDLRLEHPKAPATVIYEMLIKAEGRTNGVVSPSTVFRYLKQISSEINFKTSDDEREIKMFSHEFPNEVWQSDVMYGAYIKNGKTKLQTYLIAYIDDASRLITYGQFYHTQNFEVLRHSFKEAVLRRGIPKIIYTDNGRIFRCQQFEWMCADLGTSIIHSKPFVPRGRGKIERFFKTVRKRFLSTLDINEVKDIEELNYLFQKWLNEDYQKKEHSSLNKMSPLDTFMLNISKVNIPDNPVKLKEKFYLRSFRKVSHAATFTINNLLYETSSKFQNTKVEIRYEPEWLGVFETPLLIYKDNKKVGEAKVIDYVGNSNMKRKSCNKVSGENNNDNESIEEKILEQTISYKDMI